MYPIITEIGPQTYEIFGVKLKPVNSIEEVIANSNNPLITDPYKLKALKRILTQGSNDDLFVKGADGKPCIEIDYWLKVSQDIIMKRAREFKYNSIAQVYTASRLYSPVYDNIIEVFEDYFDTGDDIKRNISLLYELNRCITILKAIGFKLVRETDKKIIVDPSKIRPIWLGSPNCLLKANTESLMVLTGNTSYVDDDQDIPIILDGKIRKLIPWKDVTQPRALNEKFFSTYSSK